MTILFTAILDATLDESPVPTIRTKEALDKLNTGDILKVITSKESTVQNIRTLVKYNSFELLNHVKNEEGFVFYIKKI